MNRRAIALGLAATLSATSLAGTASAETAISEEASKWTLDGVKFANPFDSSTWWDGSEGSHEEMERVAINPMNPEFWIGFIRPDTHTRMHVTFTDPATLSQFFDLDTYKAMVDPDTLAKWIELETYAPLADPQTYAYWTQPGAYMHVVEATHYAQMIDPSAYTDVFTAAFSAIDLQDYLPETATEE